MEDNPNNISIRLTHSPDEEASYGELTHVSVEILNNHNAKIGSIRAVLVDRQSVPERCFYSSFDEHSADLQWIGCALMEPRYGRTKLQSLAEYDDPEFDFMYISHFHVDDEYKNVVVGGVSSSSDVAAIALRQFLHHPFVSGQLQYGCWKVSSVAYVLDPLEAMTQSEVELWDKHKKDCREYDMEIMTGTTIPPASKQAHETECRRWEERMQVFARQDANPFLRNGFFQEKAIARKGGSDARILVASHYHFREPLKSHAQALAVQFCTPDPTGPEPLGKDAELSEYIKAKCSEYPRPNLASVRQQVQTLLQAGATVAGSHGLHAACGNNEYEIVKLLVEQCASAGDATTINGYDTNHYTPLMVAAMSAAGRSNKDGVPETRVIDYLLANGADKGLQDKEGLTAYGVFQKARNEFTTAMQAMMGMPVRTSGPGEWSDIPSERALEAKLIPPNGPSPNDLTGGGGERSGIMDYSAQDLEADREMGRLDGDDGGDY